MPETETHTVETAYGEAEIETYDCDSCGTKVAYENTVHFQIGERKGRACQHCEDNGPISMPRKAFDVAIPDFDKSSAFLALLFGPLTVFMLTLDFFENENDKTAKGALLGVLIALLWIVLPLTLEIVL